MTAALNMPKAAPFAPQSAETRLLAQSNHIIPNARRFVCVGNSIFFISKWATCLNPPTKLSFFFPLQTGHFWNMKIKGIFGFHIAALLFCLFNAKLNKLREGHN